MKKFLVLVLTVAMLLSIVAIPTYAIPEGCTAIDATALVQYATVAQMYTNGLPIIRDDAQFVYATLYDLSTTIGKNPGATSREIVISDFNEEAYKDQAQFDVSYLGDGLFSYYAIWQNNAADGQTAKSVYSFSVPTAGTYEFVILGCAQIKEADVGNDKKDRGFSYSVDGGQKYQVNISDTPLIFREYTYSYSFEDAVKESANQTNTYYQMGYVYNITAELTAGDHTFEYYHLEYSNDTVLSTGNGSRLNFAGFYYQKALTAAELAEYKYPKAPETTEPAATTPIATKPAETTTAKPTATTSPETTETPATTEPATDGGCGSAIASASLIIAFAGAAFVAAKRRH